MAYRHVAISIPVFRAMWLDLSVTCADIRARFDCSQEYLSRQAKRLGLPSRAYQGRARIGGRDFAAMWTAGVKTQDMCDHFGCSRKGLEDAVKRLGLPQRPKGGLAEYLLTIDRYQRGIRIGGDEFRAMWAGYVALPDMAAYFGICTRAVADLARRLGLPARAMGRRKCPSLAQWRMRVAQDQLRVAMATAARVEQAALRRADMVDRLMSDDGLAAIVAARRARETRKAVAA